MDYIKAVDKLAGRTSRKVGNNTYLQRRDEDTIAVKLHDTDVVTFRRNGDIVLNSGGWRTVTTKARMNDYAPGRIYSDKGVWYWNLNGDWRNGLPYADGITLHSDGTVTGQGKDPKADLRLRARVRAYAKSFVQAMRDGKVEAPGAGDCFYCGMRTVDGNVPLGESVKDRSHIMSHLDEGYYVPSLLWRALEVMPSSPAMKSVVASIWQGEADDFARESFIWQQIAKCLSRYIMRQLGLAA